MIKKMDEDLKKLEQQRVKMILKLDLN